MKIDKGIAQKLKELVVEINKYEEGDTGDIPGYYYDEDLESYVNAILELLGFDKFDFYRL